MQSIGTKPAFSLSAVGIPIHDMEVVDLSIEPRKLFVHYLGFAANMPHFAIVHPKHIDTLSLGLRGNCRYCSLEVGANAIVVTSTNHDHVSELSGVLSQQVERAEASRRATARRYQSLTCLGGKQCRLLGIHQSSRTFNVVERMKDRVSEHQHPRWARCPDTWRCAEHHADEQADNSCESLHPPQVIRLACLLMTRHTRRSMVGMLAGGFVAFLAAPASSLNAAAGPQIRAGDTCRKVGRKKTVAGKTFECVEEGGVRQWKRAQASTKPQQPTKPDEPSTSDVKVLESSALALGKSQNVVVTSGGRNFAVVVTRTPSGVVAFNRACTHQGTLVTVNSANQLYCISHDSLFNLTTGAVIEGPASRALTAYKATERSGSIYITL